MKSKSKFYTVHIIFIVIFFEKVNSVPNEICLDRFNGTDCGVAPTSVFYYYRPGSRCEVRTWRGCPTLNRFPNFFSCLHFCVVRIWGEGVATVPALAALPTPTTVASTLPWKEDLKHMAEEDIDIMDNMLDDVVDPDSVEGRDPQHSQSTLKHEYEDSDSLFKFDDDYFGSYHHGPGTPEEVILP